MAMLCDACKPIFSDSSLNTYPTSDDESRQGVLWYDHHTSMDSRRAARSKGCVVCSWMPIHKTEDSATAFTTRRTKRNAYEIIFGLSRDAVDYRFRRHIIVQIVPVAEDRDSQLLRQKADRSRGAIHTAEDKVLDLAWNGSDNA
ncbi:hypothetical protein AC579_4688 [Pseudocercospora musae]|uniref:Uncharacterized protein n=1 Tax=Pseudocercospora musae TaxID=113226 RepID=A0A139IBM2_9PEZI|nr:hypothetical protein AC579_4688 [Pseudocercospora musae]